MDGKKKWKKETQERRKNWSAVKQSDAKLSPLLIVRHKASKATSIYVSPIETNSVTRNKDEGGNLLCKRPFIVKRIWINLHLYRCLFSTEAFCEIKLLDIQRWMLFDRGIIRIIIHVADDGDDECSYDILTNSRKSFSPVNQRGSKRLKISNNKREKVKKNFSRRERE